MKIIATMALAVYWLSGVAIADIPIRQSAESIVTCASAGTHLVLSRSIAEGFNVDLCRSFDSGGPDACAPCITSLEAQGCKVVDVVATNAITNPDTGIQSASMATSLVSCVSPC